MKYKRILLKLSGESAGGPDGTGLDAAVLTSYAKQVRDIIDAGCQVAIVIGGGNIFRGLGSTGDGYDRVKGDQMGMLATVINSLALESFLTRAGCNAKVFTSIRMEPVGELYSRDKASAALDCGCVAILAGGTGNPFFTTDTAAALRATQRPTKLPVVEGGDGLGHAQQAWVAHFENRVDGHGGAYPGGS